MENCKHEMPLENCTICSPGRESIMETVKPEDAKNCTKCGGRKLLSEFPENKICKDGHAGTCRTCINDRVRELKKSRKLGKSPASKKPAAPPPIIEKSVDENPVADIAENHWQYIESVIRNEYDSDGLEMGDRALDLDTYIRRVGHHYKSAFIHGFKHGAN